MTENWYATTTCKIHFDMHTPEDVENVGRDFDPQAFASAIKQTGAEAVCFFARCAYGWSYYPTTVGVPHPHLTRDLFGEGVTALKKEGIRVIAYCAMDNAPLGLTAHHPDWLKRSPEGDPLPGHGSAASCCAFGPFPHQVLIPQFCEIAERYPVDGFFLDGVYQYFNKVCYCKHCRDSFGRDIPQDPEDPNWRLYRHWQVQRVWETLGLAADKVKEIRPGCVMGVNWMAAIRWSVPPPPSLGYLTGDPPMRDCAFDTAFNLAAWAWRDKPADLMTQRMLHSWQDFTCHTPETIQTEFATGLAAGGRLFIGDLLQPVEVQPDTEAIRLMRNCFTFIKARQNLASNRQAGSMFCHACRYSDIAILSSPETIRSQGQRWGVDDTPLRGAYFAITAGGLTADILYDADLTDHLARYQTLVIPEQRFVSRQAGTVIQQFVQEGGSLVIVGTLPECVEPEEQDEAAEALVFEKLTGLASDGMHPFDLGYLRLRGTPAEDLWREGDDFLPDIPVRGTPARVITEDAEVIVRLVAPGQTYQIGARPPGQTLDAPALTFRRFGQGQVLFCALPLASDVWRRGNPGARYVIERMVRKVTPMLRIERIGSSAVQIYRSECGDETLIHLVAYQPGGHTEMPHIIDSPCPVTGIQVYVRDQRQLKSVNLKPDVSSPDAQRVDGGILIDIPPFVTHIAAVIQWHQL